MFTVFGENMEPDRHGREQFGLEETSCGRTDGGIVQTLSRYVVDASGYPLPEDVVERTKEHVLDTLAAMISGSELLPGRLGQQYVQRQNGGAESTVAGSSIVAGAEEAAFANAMSAHADETDDSHWTGRLHPGAATLPAALAVAERQRCGGQTLLRAVALGYDVGVRINLAIGTDKIDRLARSKPTIGGIWAAGAASGALMRLAPQQVAWLIAYLAQQTCGVASWSRDIAHAEKAFAFAALPARVGVMSALMVDAGFTATDDTFGREPNLFDTFGGPSEPDALVRDLGSRFEILAADIKRWPVGFPIIPVMDSLTALIAKEGLRAEEIAQVTVHIAPDHLAVVGDAAVPSLNLAHLVAVAILDGQLKFASAHDDSRLRDPAVLAVREKVRLVADPALRGTSHPRQAIVEVRTNSGADLRHHTISPRGTAMNPMTRAEVEEKARNLMAPVIGDVKTTALIREVWRLESVTRVNDLRPLLQPLVSAKKEGRVA